MIDRCVLLVCCCRTKAAWTPAVPLYYRRGQLITCTAGSVHGHIFRIGSESKRQVRHAKGSYKNDTIFERNIILKVRHNSCMFTDSLISILLK